MQTEVHQSSRQYREVSRLHSAGERHTPEDSYATLMSRLGTRTAKYSHLYLGRRHHSTSASTDQKIQTGQLLRSNMNDLKQRSILAL